MENPGCNYYTFNNTDETAAIPQLTCFEFSRCAMVEYCPTCITGQPACTDIIVPTFEPSTEDPGTNATTTENPANNSTSTEGPGTNATSTEGPGNNSTITEAPENNSSITEAPENNSTITEAPETNSTVTEDPGDNSTTNGFPNFTLPGNNDTFIELFNLYESNQHGSQDESSGGWMSNVFKWMGLA